MARKPKAKRNSGIAPEKQPAAKNQDGGDGAKSVSGPEREPLGEQVGSLAPKEADPSQNTQANEKWQRRHSGANLLFTAVLTGATIVGAYLSREQLRQSVEQVRAARLATVEANKSNALTRQSNEALVQQLEIAARSLEEENRARLVIERVPMAKMNSGVGGAFLVWVRSAGKVPAAERVTLLIHTTTPELRDTAPAYERPSEAYIRESIMEPGEIDAFPVYYDIYSEAEIAEFAAQRHLLYAYFILRYEDEFRIRCLAFCRVWNGPDAPWSSCEYVLPRPSFCGTPKQAD